MSLTHEQKELLKALALVYISGYRGPFIFSQAINEVDTGTLVFNGCYANVIVNNVDEADFIYLDREGLVTLSQSSGSISGKVTMTGVTTALRWIPQDQRNKPPTGVEARGVVGVGDDPVEAGGNMDDAGEVERERPIVFIGHGRSKDWLELKNFIGTRLRLECVEFNSDIPAGKPTVERLQEMLEAASFALLVLTAEDEHADGRRHARENVIHEAGLFQGRLGFSKAILLVEDGCEIPSNLHGLTHLGFPKDCIRATYADVLAVLENEVSDR
jgi:hypothetical protein